MAKKKCETLKSKRKKKIAQKMELDKDIKAARLLYEKNISES